MVVRASPPSGQRSLLRDQRGGVVEKILLIGLLALGVVTGLRFLSRSTNAALGCQGESMMAIDQGGRPCGRDPAVATNVVPLANANEPPPSTCSGPACMCFPAGTLVVTVDGLSPIEDVRPGTRVLARHEEGGEIAWKPVVQTFVSESRSLVRLRISRFDGRTDAIETTGNHPFFSESRGWIEARALVAGVDLLIDEAGDRLRLDEIESLDRQVPVYNFEVADFHTYFVGRLGAWVHNTKVAPTGGVTPVALPLPSPIGSWVPTPHSDNGYAQVMFINSDMSYNVQLQSQQRPYYARLDQAGNLVSYPPIGSRIPLSLPGRPDLSADALVIGIGEDSRIEFEAFFDGQRFSGHVPLGSNQPTFYTPPNKRTHAWGSPIASIQPSVTADQHYLYTAFGNLVIQSPIGKSQNPDPLRRQQEDNFLPTVLNDLETLSATPSGQQLLQSLQNQGGPAAGPVTIQYSPDQPGHASATPSSFNSDWQVNHNAPGTGSASVIRYNPYVDGLTIAHSGRPDPAVDFAAVQSGRAEWLRASNNPAYLVLFHELVHADDFRKGIRYTGTADGTVPVSEERAVGLGDFSADGIYSENTLRTDLGLPLRPGYGNPEMERYSTDTGRRISAADFVSANTAAAPTRLTSAAAPVPRRRRDQAAAGTTTGAAPPTRTPSEGSSTSSVGGAGTPGTSAFVLRPGCG